MTEAQQVIALEELAGKLIHHEHSLPRIHIGGNRFEIFKPLESYDAILALIRFVCEEEQRTTWGLFVTHFLAVIKPGWWNPIPSGGRPDVSEYPTKIIAVAFVATPKQLCESLLRATGKWKD